MKKIQKIVSFLLWKKVSKYNFGDKKYFFSNFKFDNIYSFIFAIIIVALLFLIVQKIFISHKNEKNIEQEREFSLVANQEKKGFNGMNIYFFISCFYLDWIYRSAQGDE